MNEENKNEEVEISYPSGAMLVMSKNSSIYPIRAMPEMGNSMLNYPFSVKPKTGNPATTPTSGIETGYISNTYLPIWGNAYFG